MNKTALIFRHEFLKNIRRTGFIVLTLAMPVVALLAIGIFHITAGITKPLPEVTKIGYVGEVGSFEQVTTQGNINFVRFDTPQDATQAMLKKDVTEYLIIPPDFISTGIIQRFIIQKEFAPSPSTIAAIDNFINSNLLAGKVSANIITRVEMPPNLVTTTLTETGAVAPQQGGYANFIVPGLFSLLLALSLIFTSTYVLQSLAEEKENRLMEILLSSVSTKQLLVGKVLGLGAIGLVQVIVWVISLPLLLNLASSSLGGFLSAIQIPANFWVLGVIYFILGYAVFAVLSSSVAAVTSTVQEASSLAGMYTLFAVAPFWFVSLLLFFPNNPVWIVFTIFPFSAPTMTMMRLGLTGVPVWQLAASTAVMALSIVGGLLLSARLLRVYMLMYGKRPGLRQMIRSLRG